MTKGKSSLSLSWVSRTGLNCERSTALRRIAPSDFLSVAVFSTFSIPLCPRRHTCPRVVKGNILHFSCQQPVVRGQRSEQTIRLQSCEIQGFTRGPLPRWGPVDFKGCKQLHTRVVLT